MHLSSASPRGGGGADVGEYGDFMGTLQHISALVVGEIGGLRFLNALLSGETSIHLREDWERSIVRSIDGKMVEEKFRTAYTLLRIEKVDFL